MYYWVMTSKPVEVRVLITELPTLVKTDGLKGQTQTNAITH